MSSFIRQEKEALSFFCILIAFIGLSSAVLASGDGISAKINGDVYAQPRVIGDIDGDGNKEIIFGATDGKIHIFSANGKEIFRPPYWPKQVDSPILSGVEVSDLSGNNDDLSIVTASMNGTVYCLDASGKTRWTYKTGGSHSSGGYSGGGSSGGGHSGGGGHTGGSSGGGGGGRRQHDKACRVEIIVQLKK